MWNSRELIDTLWAQPYLRFYEIMHYPVPKQSKIYFQYSDTKITSNKHNIQDLKDELLSFSWEKKSKYMDEYITEINRLESIFKSIPFVKQIFLCNSITFNALDDNSDIDLFIICNPWRIRSVKFRSLILFSLKWVKRWGNDTRKKICLSFFITSEQENLYSISLSSLDIYLAYWISHLVLIYWDKDNNTFFSQNKRVKWILPNYQEKQTISLWINVFKWNTRFKNFIEQLWTWAFWNMFEFVIKQIQKAIINIKIKLHPDQNKDVIVSDTMLKFHQDIREKISLLYSVKVK